jgi:hypothetical protein
MRMGMTGIGSHLRLHRITGIKVSRIGIGRMLLRSRGSRSRDLSGGPTFGEGVASYLGARGELRMGLQGGTFRMSIKKKLAAFLLASAAMLGVSGCYHHHHYDDHHPPPPGYDHDHDH